MEKQCLLETTYLSNVGQQWPVSRGCTSGDAQIFLTWHLCVCVCVCVLTEDGILRMFHLLISAWIPATFNVVFSYFSSVYQANATTVHRFGHDHFHPGPFHITSHQPDCRGLWQYREVPGLCQKYSPLLGTLDVTRHFWQCVQISDKSVIYCYNQ